MHQFRLPVMIAAAALAVTACVPITPMPGQAPTPAAPVAVPAPAPTGLDAASRSIARTTINVEMQKRLPGANVAPYTDCIMNNATTAELVDLVQMTNSATPGAADSVAAIVKRPATTQCIASAASTAAA